MKTVLVVEDRLEDIILINRVLQRTAFACKIQVVTDGQKLMDYLSGTGPYANRNEYPIPALILLDINTPRRNGHEALTWVRSQSEFEFLPVVMLTSSSEQSDIERAYCERANSYLVKPVLYGEFENMLSCVLDYWLNINHKSSAHTDFADTVCTYNFGSES
ncbi:MAG: response regulator receiver protein [Pedosphaera sp.]|nr:response regulator receiver protein [Pedosphaera sp.]